MYPAFVRPNRPPVNRRPVLTLLITSLLLSCAAAAQTAAPPDQPVSRTDVRWLQRATFGIDSASLASYRQLGRQRWLDTQLADRDDTAASDRQPDCQLPGHQHATGGIAGEGS
jgi:hypothetical protein